MPELKLIFTSYGNAFLQLFPVLSQNSAISLKILRITQDPKLFPRACSNSKSTDKFPRSGTLQDSLYEGAFSTMGHHRERNFIFFICGFIADSWSISQGHTNNTKIK